MVESFPMKLEMSVWRLMLGILCSAMLQATWPKGEEDGQKQLELDAWYILIFFFLWDLNSPDIFWKRSNMQSIQETIALHIACFPVQILEGSDSIMGYMTCCSQMSEVRVWRKVGKMHSRVVTLVFMKLDFNLFWQFLCPRFKMLGRIPTGSGHEGKKVHKRNRCFSKKTY